MSTCDYGGVFALAFFIALVVYYVTYIIYVIMQQRREKDIK